MDAYWACKQKMFTENLARGPKAAKSVAVINRNDPRGREFFGRVPVRALSVGLEADNDVHPVHVSYDLSGIRATLATPGAAVTFDAPLVGRYNLENILCAAGVAAALNLAPEAVRRGIEGITVVPGRLEAVPNDSNRFVYVDYAHTPDALDNVLGCLAPMAAGRLICIFGCGGDRDRSKRPQMGTIAGKRCDLVVVTSDNPRSESPEAIIGQILPAVAQQLPKAYSPAALESGFTQKGHVVESDRRAAIRLGLIASRPGDIILIAGKGHETYQLVGGQRLDFDDRREAARVLAEMNRVQASRN
jgi:UDP-N-acetylmuramyl-tripeptide synthetase